MEVLIALVSALYSLFTPSNVANEIDVPIIMYHHIEEDESKLNDFTVTSNKFEKDMLKISEMGFKTISYEDLYNFVENDQILPENPIIITFDDGYESNYLYAYPVLKRYNMKATIATIGIMIGKDNYKGVKAYKHFSYEEAKEMYNSGLIDIQSHSYDMHNISDRIGIKRRNDENEDEYINVIKEDILKSMNGLSENIKNKQLVFTYPYGAYDDLTEKILQELGYKITVTTDPGVNHIVRGDKKTLLKLKRFDIGNNTDIKLLLSNEKKPL